ARYPVYVSTSRSSVPVTASISAGMGGGDTVRWVQQGAVLATDSATGTSYQGTKNVPLTSLPTYVRAEARDGSGQLVAMSEPIFFFGLPNLPAGMSFHVDGVGTSNGENYTKIAVKGITASSYAPSTNTLSVTLTDPANSL